MNPRRRTFLQSSALAVTAAMLAACGGGTDEATGGSPAEEDTGSTALTVGVIPILDVAPLYLGVERGFFSDRGLDVTLELAQGGAAIVPAVLSGQFQFGFSNNTSLLLGRAQDLPLKIVAPGSSSTGVDGEDFASVMVPADSEIQRAADLAGHTVAINTLNNISDTVIRETVRKDGGDGDAVEFVELAFPDMPAALAEGQVDAVFAVEPFMTITTNQGARPVASAYALATENLSVATYFTSEQYIASDPDVVDAFSEAMIQSQEYATANPDEVRRIITTYTTIEPDLVDQLVLPAYASDINEDSIQALDDLAVTDGLLEEEVDIRTLLDR